MKTPSPPDFAPDFAAALLMKPFAHRGLFENTGDGHHAPENSMAAFQAACRAGYGIELDVALTACGTVVAFHDDDLVRLCGQKGFLKEMTFDDVRHCRLLGSQQSIPRLADVLQAVAGTVPLMIELKAFDSRAGFHADGRLEEACLKLCAAYQGPHAFKSFNPGSVARLKAGGALGPVGFLACDYSKDGDFPFLSPQEAQAHKELTSPEARAADFISYSLADLNEALRATVKATVVASGPWRGQERPLLVWTVRTEADFTKARSLADNIVFEWRGVPPTPFEANLTLANSTAR